MKNNKVLITGVNGFTGKYLKEEMERNGWEVFGIGRNIFSDNKNYAQVDLLDLDGLRKLIADEQPTAVAHLAGIAFPAHHSSIDFYNTHVQGTLNLLMALSEKATNIKKILLSSSGNVYGNTVSGSYDEKAPLKPFNDYGVSKLAMEYMSWLWREKLPIVISRPFNYTGVGQSKDFLVPKIVSHFKHQSKFIELGNLDFQRNYSDVRDVVFAYRKLIEEKSSSGAVNVCSDRTYTVREIVSIAEDIAGYKISISVNPKFIRPNEVQILTGNSARLKSIIGMYNSTPFSETLKWMITH
jgi:GDP-6-deoxy-D-talose 4-dehydrogenase